MSKLALGLVLIAACNGDSGQLDSDAATDPGACEEGTAQACGTDVGLCEFGSQTCTGGLWGECKGGVAPTEESCGNGTDEDCDGLVDEMCGWAVRAGGLDDDSAGAVTAVSDGIIVAGFFDGSATFGQGEANETTLTGNHSMFLARYELDGTFAWARQATSAVGHAVSALPDDGFLVVGNVYPMGFGPSTATFGPGETHETVLTDSTGQGEIFVARYGSDGSLTWARQAGGDGGDYALAIATLDDGGALVTGVFADQWVGAATFGSGQVNETVLWSGGYADVFVARYDGEGTLVWAKRAGGPDRDFGIGIAALDGGAALVTGSYGWGSLTPSSAVFGPGEAGETVLADPTASGNIFVARYEASGALTWAVWAGGSEEDSGEAIAALPDGSFRVAGTLKGIDATFGPGEPGEVTLGTYGDTDIFVAAYQPTGEVSWAVRAGGTERDRVRSLAVLPSGSAVVTGSFAGDSTFALGEIGQTTLHSQGGADVFVARYTASGQLQWATRAGGSGDDFGGGLALLGDESPVVAGSFEESATFFPNQPFEVTLNAVLADAFVARFPPSP